MCKQQMIFFPFGKLMFTILSAYVRMFAISLTMLHVKAAAIADAVMCSNNEEWWTVMNPKRGLYGCLVI